MKIYAERIKDLQYLLRRNKLDAVVVSRPTEVGFLTGFHLEGCLLLVTRKELLVFTGRMLFDHVSSTVMADKILAAADLKKELIAELRARKIGKAAFEPETVSYPEGCFWKKRGLREKSGLVTVLRRIKKGEEIKALRKSCRAAADVFAAVRRRVKAGRTEISVARELEDLMQAKGAKGPSFDIIVAFGPNSALPHHETSERKLKKNEAVLIDYGCRLDFYCSDMTRTFFYGRPGEEFRRVYSIVEKAQKLGIKAVKSGVKAKLVDKACRDFIADSGYGQYFIHGTGHGIGLEIHEDPYLNTRGAEVLKEGMAVTVEPGIYLKGKFGVRIEDSVLVRKDRAEILTKTGK